MLNAYQFSIINNDLSASVAYYDQYRSEFISKYNLSKYAENEWALKAIWSSYVSHNLKEYGNGPPTLEISALLATNTVMCSQYTTIALNIMQEFGASDTILRPIGWDKSYIGNHSEILFSSNGANFLIDPTVGIVIDQVSVNSIFGHKGSGQVFSFAKNNELKWYADLIIDYYKNKKFSLDKLVYLSDGFSQWTNNLQDAMKFDGTILGVRYQIGSSNSDNLVGDQSNDIIFGRDGNDILVSAGSGDKLFGGSGNDKYFVTNKNTFISESIDNFFIQDAGGVDKVFSTVSFKLPDYIENITLTGYQKTSAVGNSLSNKIYGNDAPNKIMCGTGSDFVAGLGGGDSIYLGADIDKDIVKFFKTQDSTLNFIDKIFQFTTGVDKLDLGNIDFDVNRAGINKAKFGDVNFTKNGLWCSSVNNDMYLHGDVNGDFIPDISIKLVGCSTLNKFDIIY